MAENDWKEILRKGILGGDKLRDDVLAGSFNLNKEIPPLVLGGPSGIGKTEVMKRFLENMEDLTKTSKDHPKIIIFDDEIRGNGKSAKEILDSMSDIFNARGGTFVFAPDMQAAGSAPVDAVAAHASNGRAVATAFRQGTGGRITALRPARFK